MGVKLRHYWPALLTGTIIVKPEIYKTYLYTSSLPTTDKVIILTLVTI